MANIDEQLVANFNSLLATSISIEINSAFNSMSTSLTQVNSAVQSLTNSILEVQVAQNNFNSIIQSTQNAQNDLTDTINETEDAQNDVTDAVVDTTQAVDQQISRWEKIKQHIAQASQMAMKLGTVAMDVGKGSLTGAAADDDMRRKFIVTSGSGTKGTEMFEEFKKNTLSTSVDPTESLNGTLEFMKESASSEEIDKLNNLATKMSTLTGNSYESAIKALTSGMNGDTESLSNDFGIPASGMDKMEVGKKGESGNFDGYVSSLDSLMAKQGLTQAAFETMMDSPTNKWTQLTNNYSNSLSTIGTTALSALVPALDSLNNAFASDQFQVMLQGLAIGFAVVANIIVLLVQGLLYLISVFQQYWSIAAPILSAIAFVLLAAMIIQLGIIAAEWLMIVWPILLVMAIIAAVIYVLQMLGMTGGEVIGMVISFFGILFATVANIISTLWNLWLGFCEFLINVFIDPIYAIKKLIYDFAMAFWQILFNLSRGVESFAGGFLSAIKEAINGMIGAINKFLPVLNKLFGWNMAEIKIWDGKQEHLFSDKIQGMMDSMTEPTSNKNVIKLQRTEILDTDAIKDSSYKTGDQLTKSGSNMVNSFSGPGITNATQGSNNKAVTTASEKVVPGMTAGSSYNPSSSAFTSSNSPTTVDSVKTVNNVDNVGGTVDISSEDLKMMRDLAELQAIQNFVSLTPTVQVTTGDINSGADLDTIVGHIGRKLEEEFVSTAQGVYT